MTQVHLSQDGKQKKHLLIPLVTEFVKKEPTAFNLLSLIKQHKHRIWSNVHASICWRAGISISPDGKNYAIAGNGMNSAVLDLMTDKTIFSFSEEQWIVFTPDGKSLVTTSQEGIKVLQ